MKKNRRCFNFLTRLKAAQNLALVQITAYLCTLFFCCYSFFPLAATTITVNLATDVDQLTGGKYLFGPMMETDLRGALNHINQNPGNNPYIINFDAGLPSNSTINLGAMLPLLNFHGFTNSDTTINGALTGGRITINGQNLWRGFFVADGTNGAGRGEVVLQNMIIENVTATGGKGGGGGMGAGAGVFIDNADVTLSNVDINTATVNGGAGGSSGMTGSGSTALPIGGGGLGIGSTGSDAGQAPWSGAGGLGGTGGLGNSLGSNRGGGGGGGINCGAGYTGTGGAASSGVGTAGGAIGAVSGGGTGGPIGNPGGAGGATGGGGGGSTSMTAGGGGGGGILGATGDVAAGSGGYGGGGGTSNNTLFGGAGGFGGGAGSSESTLVATPIGGFGGGGCTQNVTAPFTQRGGVGGFGGGGGFAGGLGGVGGGRGATSIALPVGSGGGAGFGGAIFIRSGSLTIEDTFSTNNANNATGGLGGTGTGGAGFGSNGWGAGKDCFFMSGTTIDIDPKGGTITMTNSIADDSPSSFVGAGSGITVGAGAGSAIAIGSSGMGGTVKFLGPNTYGGLTTISSGTLQAGNNTALGATGAIVVSGATLQLLSGFNIAVPLGISGTGVSGIGALTQDSGVSSTYSGAITLNANATINTNGGGTLTLSGGIVKDGKVLTLTGGGTIAVNGTGISGATSFTSDLIVSAVTTNLNVANTYVGPTFIINGATLNATAANALPTAATRTTISMDLTGTGSSFLVLGGGSNQAIQSLAGAASSAVNLNANQLTVGTTAGSTTFAGSISGSGGSLVKDGASTQILTGSNTYSGGTTVSGGILQGNAGSLQGSITNNSTVDFDQTGSGTYAGNMSGSGVLIKSNSGVLILTGTNSYAGGTTVSGGILQGDTVSLQGNIINNAAVVFDQASNSMYAGDISGSGSLTKANTGILILTGIYTYGGGTTVSGGVLQGNTTTLQGNITNNASVVFDQAAGGTYAGDMSGSGSLTKANAGTLVLTGSNSYGGGTTVSAGVLQGNTTSLQGAITNNTSVIFDQASNGTYAGDMSGAGSLTKANAGTLVLTGSNSYGGATTINAGVLQGNTTSLQGNITNNAAIVFDQTANGTYAGNISGTGSLTKENGGTLLLTGTNNYSGTTDIIGGKLAVNGPLTSGAVTVGPSGTLSGNSSITADVVNQGIVSPGNSIDTLTILGNYTQVSGSTLLIEVSPTAADLLSISGTATIQPDATMAIFPSPGTFPATNSYTVLSSAGLTGTFTNTPNNLPTVQFTVRYDANNVYLDIGVSGFITVTTGGNVGAVANYIDSLSPASGSDLAFVIGVLRLLDVSQLDQALAEMQPSPYKNLILAQEENVFTVSRGISDHLNDFFNTRCRREIDSKKRWQVWGTGFGDWAKFDNRSDKAGPANTILGYNATSEGGLVGTDYCFTKGCVLGLTGGYSYTDVHVNESRARGHINSAYGALYGMIYGSNLFLDASFIGGYDWFHASRKIQFGVTNGPSIDRRPYTDHDGWSINGHVDGGYFIDQWQALEIRPFFALDCTLLHENAFEETGADSLNLSVRESNNTLLRSEAGVNFSKCFRVKHGKWIPEVRASAVWENFSSGSAYYQSNFVGQPGSFTVVNRNPNRTLFSPGVGLTGVFREDRVLLSVDYNGEFGHGYQNQVGKAELSWMF